MPHLETLGNVLTCGLAIVAIIVVPIKLARAWWPEVKAHLAARFLTSPDGEHPPRAAGRDEE